MLREWKSYTPKVNSDGFLMIYQNMDIKKTTDTDHYFL